MTDERDDGADPSTGGGPEDSAGADGRHESAGTADADPRSTDGDAAGSDPAANAVGRGLFEREMAPSSAAAHLYRGEIHRMRFWRERLDQTTYWAIVVMSAVLTWTFTSRNRPHYLLLIGAAALVAFLVIEARRYRGYDIWRGRVRTLQRNVFAYGLDPSAGLPDPEWRSHLAEDYRSPAKKIPAEEAIAHRLRRVYLLLFGILLGAWTLRVTAFTGATWPESAAVGEVPGVAVTIVVGAGALLALAIAVRPRSWTAADELHGEDLGRYR